MSEILNRFKQVNISEYPDVHLLTDEADTIFWVLLVGEEQLGIDAMSASEVANIITHVLRKDLSRQRAAAVLTSSKGLVLKVSKSGITRFRLMRQGADRIRGRAGGIIFVDLSTAFTALCQLDQLLSSVKGELLLCDSYVDDKTLLALTSVPPTSPIKLLTLNISDPHSSGAGCRHISANTATLSFVRATLPICMTAM